MALRTAAAFIGAAALAFLLWEPHLEGRNAHASLFEIYFKDPFLAYVYIGSIPFFAALYRAFRALGYAGREELFMPEAIKALRSIRHCALAVICFAAIGEVIIMLSVSDDRAGGVFMGLLVICGAAASAIIAAFLEKRLRRG